MRNSKQDYQLRIYTGQLKHSYQKINSCKYRVNNIINNVGSNEFGLNNKILLLEHKLEEMSETNKQILQILKEKDSQSNIINIENMHIDNIENIKVINTTDYTSTSNNTMINSYGNEKQAMDILSKLQMKHVISQGGNAITKLINYKHYNDNVPENHNMLLNRIKDEKMLIFNGNNFEEILTNDIISDLIAKSYADIYGILQLIEMELNDKEKRNIQRLIYKIEQNNQDTKNMVNEELRKLMFQNRDMIIKTVQKATKTHEQRNIINI